MIIPPTLYVDRHTVLSHPKDRTLGIELTTLVYTMPVVLPLHHGGFYNFNHLESVHTLHKKVNILDAYVHLFTYYIALLYMTLSLFIFSMSVPVIRKFPMWP